MTSNVLMGMIGRLSVACIIYFLHHSMFVWIFYANNMQWYSFHFLHYWSPHIWIIELCLTHGSVLRNSSDIGLELAKLLEIYHLLESVILVSMFHAFLDRILVGCPFSSISCWWKFWFKDINIVIYAFVAKVGLYCAFIYDEWINK